MTDNATSHVLTSVGDYIRYCASRLAQSGVHLGHGTESAVDEAAALVLAALHLPPDLHPAHFAATLVMEERQKILGWLDRRIGERVPLAYLSGQAWFMGMPFKVDERVLVPRSPIAELIEHQFAPWVDDPDSVHRILDMCTGSGCIGIACAHVFADAQVDLTDVSADALAVAAENIADHAVGDRVRARQADVFEGLAGERYDVIVSNPPYVPQAEYDALPAEFRREPGIGLAAGADGLDVVRRILAGAAAHLTDAGVLVVEVGSAAEHLVQAFPTLPFIWVEFERGGDGVFVLSRNDLVAAGLA